MMEDSPERHLVLRKRQSEVMSEFGSPYSSFTENKRSKTSTDSGSMDCILVPVSPTRPGWIIPVPRQDCIENVLQLCNGDEELRKKISLALNYAALSSIYSVDTATLWLEVPQYIILSLLYSLVTDNIALFLTIMQASSSIDQLHSSFLRVWLRDDFNFDKKDIAKGFKTLRKLTQTMEIPGFLIQTLSGLTAKYGEADIWLDSGKEVAGVDIEKRLCEAVKSNHAAEVIKAVMSGGDVNFRTASGDTLLHLAATFGYEESIAALVYLKGNINVRDSKRLAPIHRAINAGALCAVKLLLELGADLKRTVMGGDTVLHLAARTGCMEIIKALIDKGSEVNAKNYSGNSPLMEAVNGGHVEAVTVLLERGAAADSVIEGKKLIEIATASGNVEMVRALRKAGADLNTVSTDGDRPLHIATCHGNIDIIKELIQGHVVVDCKNNSGFSPLHLSCERDVIKALISGGASIDLKSNAGATVLHLASASWSGDAVETIIELGATIDFVNDQGDTPLSIASSCGRVDIVKLLLGEGANPNIANKTGLSPLHRAAICGCVKSLEALLQCGAVVDSKDNLKMTAAHQAAQHGKFEALQFLIECGASALSCTDNYTTMLHSAALNGHKEVVTCLLDHHLDINAKCQHKFIPDNVYLSAIASANQSGRTYPIRITENRNFAPIHLASFQGHFSVVELLLDHRAIIDAKDSCEWTALHLAAMGGHLTVVQLLVERGLDVHVKTNDCCIAGHIAASEGHLEVLKYLLVKNTSLHATDKWKWTMLHHASARGKLEMVKYLLDQGANQYDQTVRGYTPLKLSDYNSKNDISALLKSRIKS